jgi:two-component system OmpR family response regulator
MKKILLADDDKHFLAVLTRFFAQAGYEVHAARNGQEALALARETRPDLLVLDVALPLVTGDQIARALADQAPILFISGRDLDRVADLPPGRMRFLRKPADLDEVMENARALLGEPAAEPEAL